MSLVLLAFAVLVAGGVCGCAPSNLQAAAFTSSAASIAAHRMPTQGGSEDVR